MNVAGIDIDDTVFAKTRAGAPADFFTAEAAGLDFIRVPGGPPVPAVRAATTDGLVIDRVELGRPDVSAAREFGHRLATLHNAGRAASASLPPATSVRCRWTTRRPPTGRPFTPSAGCCPT